MTIKKSIKNFAAAALLGATTLAANAQYATYMPQQGPMDVSYLALETINTADKAIQKPGYAISATAFNTTTASHGRIIRTNDKGTPLWAMRYNASGVKHRFNHIEKYFNGAAPVEFLIVGSVEHSATSTGLLIARVDDNGNVVRSVEFRSNTHNHLMGLKGIRNQNGDFAIVAIEADGFNATDDKNVVVLEVDINLNLLVDVSFSTLGVTNDYDTPSDIVESADPSVYYVVSTGNKSTSNGVTNSTSSAVASMIDMNTGNVAWSFNYSTRYGGHWDAGADGYFDGQDFWVLSNSSFWHHPTLVKLSGGAGTVLHEVQFQSPTLDIYGYEIKPTLNKPGQYTIASWRNIFSATGVKPHLMSYSPASYAIHWQWNYNTDENTQLSVSENPWLKITSLGQFSTCYSDIMGYAPDEKGYAILDTYNRGLLGKNNIWLWWDTNPTGGVDADCGYDSTDLDTTALIHYVNNNLKKEANNSLSLVATNFLHNTSYINDQIRCDGVNYKNGALSSTPENFMANGYNVYPNPARTSLTIEGSDVVSVSLTDVFGRTILTQKANGQTAIQLSVEGISSGLYVVNIATTNGDVKTHKIQIAK